MGIFLGYNSILCSLFIIFLSICMYTYIHIYIHDICMYVFIMFSYPTIRQSDQEMMNYGWCNFPVWDQHLHQETCVKQTYHLERCFFLPVLVTLPGNDHISYPHPKGCWVPMIFLVEPRTWYWLPVTMLLCWKSGSFVFPHEAVTKPKDWPNWVMIPAVLDQNSPHVKFGCIPIGFPWDYHIYLRICQIHLSRNTTQFYISLFPDYSQRVCHLRVPQAERPFQFVARQAVANLGQTANLNPLWRYGIDGQMM